MNEKLLIPGANITLLDMKPEGVSNPEWYDFADWVRRGAR